VVKLRSHLTNAPLREAVIDISIAPKAPIDVVEAAAAKADSVVGAKRTDIWEASFALSFDTDGKTKVPPKRSKLGVRLASSDALISQWKVSGLTVSRLAPYSTWAELRDVARSQWTDFSKSLTSTQRVSRVAVRYINALSLPLPVNDFSEYLAAPPVVPDELPQGLRGFLTRVVFGDNPSDYTAVVAQALEGDSGDNKITVLLDIDVFREVEMDWDSDEIWTILDRLREVKNEVFFGYLTEKTVGFFE